MKKEIIYNLQKLGDQLQGELHFDELHRVIYATDASVYRKIPLGVAFPRNTADIKLLIRFASDNAVPLIPRAAGTSLAGQCVGDGLVVDLSKYFTKIVHFDEKKRLITVQPGVVRDELNDYLKPYGLFFGPNTSTSNRCMIGGMVGNNSSGTTSIKYGVTRDKTVALKTVLSDRSEVCFESISKEEFIEKSNSDNLEGRIYKTLRNQLTDKVVQNEIKKGFPKKEIHRRNNGYAVDALLDFVEFGGGSNNINVCNLLSGSEGTLNFITEITLKLDVLPPPENIMVAAHFDSIDSSMMAVLTAMEHDLYTCELMDKTILDCTKNNREQINNRFFVEGDPKAILMLEICMDNAEDSESRADALIADLRTQNLGYAYPKLKGKEIKMALNLRSAGLGLLGNIVGDNKAVACIEDTAVALKDLPNYIADFTAMMQEFGQEAVYYAHAGAGELHLRPILNLKKQEDVTLFRKITTQTASLVKEYGGSFSGEHGDGIVRAEFIPFMIGKRNYELLRTIKNVFDPKNIFNPGKIVDPYTMDSNLRYKIDREEPEIQTIQDFTDSLGILRAAEKCNGSGDCRKLPASGGTMCPSFRATRNEKDTTRARANALREFLTNSDKKNRFNHKELYDVFELCLSCKACASECPSNVDVAALKAEFLYQYYKSNKIPFRTKMFAENAKWNRLGSIMPEITNALLNSKKVKKIMGIATQRNIPELADYTLMKWYRKNKKHLVVPGKTMGRLHLFIDEYTNYYDVELGINTISLLIGLGYEIEISNHDESGRSYISKGLLGKAKKITDKNIAHFKGKVSVDFPLVGIEPSAILSFRDEYLRLATDKEEAKQISAQTFTIEEFLQREINAGNIRSVQFTRDNKIMKIHGHCQQKSLSSMKPTCDILGLPENYKVTLMNTGCCGMAGSFGYEEEHYELSMQVGEDTLFPKVRNTSDSISIVAPGTSCRHQIEDGTGRKAIHPVTVLYEALLK